MLTMLLRGSFGGRSFSSVVINVAADQKHIEESISSLRFGERMCLVNNKGVVVVGQDAGAMAKDVQARLQAAKAALQVLEGKEQGPRFAPGADASAIKSFQGNMEKHQSLLAQLNATRQALTEARGECGSGAALTNQVADLEFQVENIMMIILRQKSIAGFYIEAKPGFTAKQAEIKALEAQAQLVGV
jgi:hypothetical protein